MIAPQSRSVHIGLQMIATPGRSSEDPLPRLGTAGAEAPEFQVLFSRPADFAGRPDSRANSFRWSGSGTIHIMERGLRGWDRGLDEYVRGLNDQNDTTVLEAFDWMSAGNEAQRQAWKVIERAER